MPMISNSTEFPFTLLKPDSEKVLANYLKDYLKQRSKEGIRDPWLCEEDEGHAILVWASK